MIKDNTTIHNDDHINDHSLSINNDTSNNTNNNDMNDIDDDDIDDDENEEEFTKLLPPTPNYHTNDDDLDELLGIEMNTFPYNNNNHHHKKNQNLNHTNNNNNNNNNNHQRKCCVRYYGNTIIMNTTCYNYYKNKKLHDDNNNATIMRRGRSKKDKKIQTIYGIIGPHYLGILFVLGLLCFGSYYFTRKAFDDVGMKSGYVCIGFTIIAFWNLIHVTCVDPGIVKIDDQLERRIKKKLFIRNNTNDDDDDDDNNNRNGNKTTTTNDDNNDDNNNGSNSDEETGDQTKNVKEYDIVNIGEEQGWRYCRACSLYQPPKAAHCPDCNVCIYEYDHHCPWMGTCIGKNNMPAFMRFNFTWLIYLLYSCFWILAFGPVHAKQHMKQHG